MKFIDEKLLDYEGDTFTVYKDLEGKTIMRFTETGEWIDNSDQYANMFLGKCESCNSFYEESFKDFNYDSVLVAGLGFGLIPNELSEVNKCSTIDVVEINQEVIDYNVSSAHLNSKVNFIKGDIFNYTSSEKYDLIIIDTFWGDGDMLSEEQHQALAEGLYENNINEGGALYIPVTHEWLAK